jgi:HEAT repeat protein
LGIYFYLLKINVTKKIPAPVDIKAILADKKLKAKAKTEAISNLLLDNSVSDVELIGIAQSCKHAGKATCIEALEFSTRIRPAMGSLACLQFVSKTLAEKAPRVKWESAKVIGNIAYLYPDKLKEAIKNLLANTEDPGTVVRWSAAFALGEIIKLKTKLNKDLVPAIEAVCKREEKNSIRKIYLAALKKVTM